MKRYAFLLGQLLFLANCQPPPMHPDSPHHPEPARPVSFSIYNGDTCNRSDGKGRQGKWYTFSGGKAVDSCWYEDDKRLEPR